MKGYTIHVHLPVRPIWPTSLRLASGAHAPRGALFDAADWASHHAGWQQCASTICVCHFAWNRNVGKTAKQIVILLCNFWGKLINFTKRSFNKPILNIVFVLKIYCVNIVLLSPAWSHANISTYSTRTVTFEFAWICWTINYNTWYRK